MENTLYFIELNKDKEFSDYNNLITLMSPEKQTQILKFRFDVDKKLSLLSDLLVRYFACNTLSLSNNDLEFTKNDFSKPFLKRYPDFQYNISHTRDAIMIGFSKKSIGVDIEKVTSHDLKIAERFFHRNELEYILSKNIDRDKYFYEVWTKKEAYIKWIGKGLSIPLISFDVTSFDIKDNFSMYQVNEYIFSVCCKDNFTESNLINLNETEVEILLTKLS